jgi:hypothetical protein
MIFMPECLNDSVPQSVLVDQVQCLDRFLPFDSCPG